MTMKLLVYYLPLFLSTRLFETGESFGYLPNKRVRIASPRRLWASSDDSLWTTLLDRFQGDFDNYDQVVQDREQGLLPKEGGGHENIHCTLVPVSEDGRLAAFYFDGNPRAIFRFRYYHLIPNYCDGENGNQHMDSVNMTLYTLNPQLEGQLRARSTEPLAWPTIFQQFSPAGSRTRLLPKCDVQWSWTADPVQHAYASSYHRATETKPGIHAVMVYGQALVESQMMPGTQILIRDQLSLWPDEFWIHDRGLDPDNLERYIYGNQRGVPYCLKRVATIGPDDERKPVSSHLEWTLGPSFRSEELFAEKVAAMGGPSAKMGK